MSTSGMFLVAAWLSSIIPHEPFTENPCFRSVLLFCACAYATISPCIAIRAPHLCPLAAFASHSCALVPFMSA
eukprot:948079-Amphidinium_carterae.2